MPGSASRSAGRIPVRMKMRGGLGVQSRVLERAGGLSRRLSSTRSLTVAALTAPIPGAAAHARKAGRPSAALAFCYGKVRILEQETVVRAGCLRHPRVDRDLRAGWDTENCPLLLLRAAHISNPDRRPRPMIATCKLHFADWQSLACAVFLDLQPASRCERDYSTATASSTTLPSNRCIVRSA